MFYYYCFVKPYIISTVFYSNILGVVDTTYEIMKRMVNKYCENVFIIKKGEESTKEKKGVDLYRLLY